MASQMDLEDPIESFPETQPVLHPPEEQHDSAQEIHEIVDKVVDDAMETACYALRKYVNQTINALVPVLVHSDPSDVKKMHDKILSATKRPFSDKRASRPAAGQPPASRRPAARFNECQQP